MSVGRMYGSRITTQNTVIAAAGGMVFIFDWCSCELNIVHVNFLAVLYAVGSFLIFRCAREDLPFGIIRAL